MRSGIISEYVTIELSGDGVLLDDRNNGYVRLDREEAKRLLEWLKENL